MSSVRSSSPPPPAPVVPIVIRLVQDPVPAPVQRSNLPTSDDDAPLPAPTKHDEFYKYWDRFTAKLPPPKTSVIPSLDVDPEGQPTHHPLRNKEGIVTSQSAGVSYEEAAASCRAKVKAIVEECRRLNQKYYDRHFDLMYRDALTSLTGKPPDSVKKLGGVEAVKRIEDIFEEPQFYIDGATANDVRQGGLGDCWFLAAITALSGKPELISKICVERDERVDVYGFVFYRDGEWISEVVDDRLCLTRADDRQLFGRSVLKTLWGELDS